uniref:Peptidase_S9 domain-containing protein n=1 Tax=Caenorhabditis japonica TaxID=281687 RepID=A0A8R1E3D8_CAEJA
MLSLLISTLLIVAQSVEIIPREVLFQDAKYSSVSLSPDAKQVGYVAPDDHGVKNVFVRCSSCSFSRQVTFETDHPVLDFVWTSLPDVIIFIQDNHGDENTKFYKKNISSAAINVDKTARVVISDKPNVKAVMMANHLQSDIVLIGLNDEIPALHNVYAFNCRTDQMTLVMRNKRFAMFFFDNDLNVRLTAQEGPDGEMIYYRPRGNQQAQSTDAVEWDEYLRIQHDDKPITLPLTFDKSNNFMYWIMGEGSDLGNLVVFPFDDPSQKEILYTAQKAQIGNVLIHPIDKTLLAVTEVYHKPELFVANDTFMEDLQYLVNLKPTGSLKIISMSIDMSTWLVTYASADEPNDIYIFRRWNKKAELFMSTRPELKKYTLNKQIGFDFRARDEITIQAYLSLPPQASLLKPSQVPDSDRVYASLGMIPAVPQKMIVLVHGGPKARDHYGFSAMNAWLTNRGYAVLQVNFRGSTGFGKALTNAGNGEWGRKMHFDILDAVEFAVSKGIANRSEIAMMGGSYGGYETLVALTFTPQTFACGVDIVGPSNLISLVQAIPPYWRGFYNDLIKMVGADIVTEDGRQSLQSRSPLFFADRVSKPIMIIQGANDPRVKQAESDQFVAALEKKRIPVTYLLYPDEGHGVRKQGNSMEQHGHIETFLQQCLGGEAQPFQPGQYNSTAILKNVGIEAPAVAKGLQTNVVPRGPMAPPIFYRPSIRAQRVMYPPNENVMTRIFPVQG